MPTSRTTADSEKPTCTRPWFSVDSSTWERKCAVERSTTMTRKALSTAAPLWMPMSSLKEDAHACASSASSSTATVRTPNAPPTRRRSDSRYWRS